MEEREPGSNGSRRPRGAGERRRTGVRRRHWKREGVEAVPSTSLDDGEAARRRLATAAVRRRDGWHGAGAAGEASGSNSAPGRFEGARGWWRRRESMRGGPTAARDFARRRRNRQHGAEAKEKASGCGGGSGRVKEAQGGWWHEELTRGETTAARKEGKWRRSTRARFRAAGAPPGPRECIPNLRWSGGTPREVDDERRPPGQSKMAGEPRRAAAGAAQRVVGGMGTVGRSPARENGVGGGGEKGEPAAGRVRLSWRRRSRDGAAPRACGRERRVREARGWGGAELLVDSSCSLAPRHARWKRRARTTTNGEAEMV
uniref:Uncharacterized protein n=1 Tax=Oryza sativa subsp. japonica TaxID=39947 RepID=Q69LV5_ORYSJ|nr:hypothetical protein [Oryza sativa Japonica Group]